MEQIFFANIENVETPFLAVQTKKILDHPMYLYVKRKAIREKMPLVLFQDKENHWLFWTAERGRKKIYAEGEVINTLENAVSFIQDNAKDIFFVDLPETVIPTIETVL